MPGAEEQWFVTTDLQFSDGHHEGQVLHVGSEDSCARLMHNLSAISYSGGQRIINSLLRIMPLEVWPDTVPGQIWRHVRAGEEPR